MNTNTTTPDEPDDVPNTPGTYSLDDSGNWTKMRSVGDPFEDMKPLLKMNKDIKEAATMMGSREARYIVNNYYLMQENRIRAAHQTRALTERELPSRLVEWQIENNYRLELQMKAVLKEFASAYTVGRWLQSIHGIGPVISAGLLAHLNIQRAPNYGHFFSFAGLNPLVKWEKKEKRPWNEKLKTLVVFKAGESFVKVQNNPKDHYGKFFKKRRLEEEEKNLAGFFKDDCARILTEKNFSKETPTRKSYEKGLFPDAHLHARARRYAAKLFLSHVHHAMFVDFYETDPPVPYPFAKNPEDHRHYLSPPNWPYAGPKGRSLRELTH